MKKIKKIKAHELPLDLYKSTWLSALSNAMSLIDCNCKYDARLKNNLNILFNGVRVMWDLKAFEEKWPTGDFIEFIKLYYPQFHCHEACDIIINVLEGLDATATFWYGSSFTGERKHLPIIIKNEERK